MQLNLKCPTELQKIRSTIATWQPRRPGPETLETYGIALETCLYHASVFDLIALGLFVDEDFLGISIAERVSASWLMSHFVASDPHRRGVSRFLLHKMAYHALGLDVQYLSYCLLYTSDAADE